VTRTLRPADVSGHLHRMAALRLPRIHGRHRSSECRTHGRVELCLRGHGRLSANAKSELPAETATYCVPPAT
jgi:hypothetical protein